MNVDELAREMGWIRKWQALVPSPAFHDAKPCIQTPLPSMSSPSASSQTPAAHELVRGQLALRDRRVDRNGVVVEALAARFAEHAILGAVPAFAPDVETQLHVRFKARTGSILSSVHESLTFLGHVRSGEPDTNQTLILIVAGQPRRPALPSNGPGAVLGVSEAVLVNTP